MKRLVMTGVFAAVVGGWGSVGALAQDAGDTLVTVPVKGNGISLCHKEDPDCRRRIMQFTGAINPAFPIRAEAGARLAFTDADGNPEFGSKVVVTLSDQLAEAITTGGDLKVLPFEMIFIPGSENFRVRFAIAESEMAFVCTRADGQGFHAPYASFFAGTGCRPDAMFGIGAQLFQFQMDTFSSHRVAMRIAEVRAVLNFLRNGFAEDYFKKRLMAYGGASADVIVPGKLAASQPEAGGAAARLNMGISGLYISDNSHWEIRGFAGYRPNVAAWGKDWAVEGGLQALYRLVLGYDFMGEIGGNVQYSHWSIPGRSIGTYASDRNQDSLYLGVKLGFYYNPAPSAPGR